MTHEDFVLDLYAVADERVTRDLARCANHRATLDLDERPDASVGADAAAIEIRERPYRDVLAELDVFDQAERSIVGRPIGHAQSTSRPRACDDTLVEKSVIRANLVVAWLDQHYLR